MKRKKLKRKKQITNADLVELILRRNLARLEMENDELRRKQK